MRYKNAVLDDKELQASLSAVNPKFGNFVARIAGEAWGLGAAQKQVTSSRGLNLRPSKAETGKLLLRDSLPLIDQKTKAFLTIAIDVANHTQKGLGSTFAAHVNMAMQQGATREEIEEVLLFACVYVGFNKAAAGFAALNEILGPAS
jgi:4-carboxymuconolactone decarboxylase